jgi:formamidopyrimidine-DNA glycosylase
MPPELPEVQTVRTQIETVLPLTIEAVETSAVVESILKKKDRQFDPQKETIASTDRIGKLLILNLASGNKILSHFGMSGGWRIGNKKILEKHTHVQFQTANNNNETLYLAYVDPRRFGNMLFLTPQKAAQYMAKLGVDIGSSAFTPEYILQTLKKYPERQIKPFLLDQKYFAGCGNYIACEICALAGIRPTRKAKSLKLADAVRIAQATEAVLSGQIKNQGLTFSGGYTDAFGDKGGGLSSLVVFHQETCGLCKKSKVKKILLAQRGTYYCPACQK